MLLTQFELPDSGQLGVSNSVASECHCRGDSRPGNGGVLAEVARGMGTISAGEDGSVSLDFTYGYDETPDCVTRQPLVKVNDQWPPPVIRVRAGEEVTHDYCAFGDYAAPPLWFLSLFARLGLEFPSVERMAATASDGEEGAGGSGSSGGDGLFAPSAGGFECDARGSLVALDFEGCTHNLHRCTTVHSDGCTHNLHRCRKIPTSERRHARTQEFQHRFPRRRR